MSHSTKILIAEPLDFSPRALDVLKSAGDVELRTTHGTDLARAFQTHEVVWFRLATRITAEMLGPEPRCRVLATPVTGLDHIDLDACHQRGIKVVALKGETEFLRTVRATAEMTLGLAIALMRHIPAASRSVLGGAWDRDRFRGHELYGQTAGIVGMGRLGSILSGYLAALGMSVRGFDPHVDFSDSPAAPERSLEELLGTCAVAFIMVSYSPATHNLIGADQFRHMQPHSYLVNTSRGGVVDECALLEALGSGHLAGAALDVLQGEPAIAEDHPLIAYARTHDNLLIVPHIGGNTYESFEKTEVFLAERVKAALAASAPCFR